MSSCAACNAYAVNRCSKCHEVFYCCRKCQASDWPTHKKTCGKVHATVAKDAPQAEEEKPESPRIVMPIIPTVSLEGEGYADWLAENKSSIPVLMVRVPNCGLQNLGNTCYLNAAVQALSCTPSLQSVLDAVDHLATHRSPDTCFLCAFEELSNGLVTSEDPLTPTRLQRKTNNKMFGDATFGEQADAQECIGFLLELLQESIVNKNGRTPAEIADAERHSMIGRLFAFDVGQCVYCTECGQESIRESSDMFLRLEITTGMTPRELAALYEPSRVFDRRAPPAASATSIKELIRHFHRPEALEDFKCDGCERRGHCEKKTLITRWPNVLLVLLDQNKSTGMWGKVDREVKCQPFLQIGDLEYVLYAMIVHVDLGGSTRFGHYVCFIHEGDGTWWLCDDADVVEVDQDYVAIQQPLFVLYQVLEHDIDVTSPKSESVRGVRYETIEEDDEVFLTARSSNSADRESSSSHVSLDCIYNASEEEDSSDDAAVSPCDASSETDGHEYPVLASSEMSDSDNEEEQSATEGAVGFPRDWSVQSDEGEIHVMKHSENRNDELSMKEAVVAALGDAFTEKKEEQLVKEYAVGFPCDGSVQSDEGEFFVVENSESKNDELPMIEAVVASFDDALPENEEKSANEDAVGLPCGGSVQSAEGDFFVVENSECKNEELSMKEAVVASFDDALPENEEKSANEDAFGLPCDGAVQSAEGDFFVVENSECKNDELPMIEAVVASFDDALPENEEKSVNGDAFGLPCDGAVQSAEGEILVVENSEDKNEELSMKGVVVAALGDTLPENEEEKSVMKDAVGLPSDGSVQSDEGEILVIENSESEDDELFSKEVLVAVLDNVLAENVEEQSVNENSLEPYRNGSVQSNEGEFLVVENSKSEKDDLSMEGAVATAHGYVFTKKKEDQSDKEDELGLPCDESSQPDEGEIRAVENSENENEQLVNENLLSATRESREFPLAESSENDNQEDQCVKEDQFHSSGELTRSGSEAPDEDSSSPTTSSELPVTKCRENLTGERTPDTGDDNTRTLETRSCSSMEAFEAVKQMPRRKSRRGSMQIWVPKSPMTQMQPARRHSRRHSMRRWIPKAQWVEYLNELRK